MIKTLLKLRDIIVFSAIIFFVFLLIVNDKFTTLTLEGIKTYYLTLFPSLFPYLFLTSLLTLTKGAGKVAKLISPFFEKVFNVSGACGYAYLMGVVSGYPIGSIMIAEFKKQNLISDTEAERASCLCATSSPSFVINVVGGLCFNSVKLGAFLYLGHLLSSIIVGLIFSNYKKEYVLTRKQFCVKQSDNVISESITSAVNSALFVGGFITLFYLLTEILYTLGVFNLPIKLLSRLLGNTYLAKGVVFALFETTKGFKILASIPISRLTFCTGSFLIGFSGLSIIMQCISPLKTAKIKTAPHLFSKFVSAVLNLIFSFIFSLWLF